MNEVDPITDLFGPVIHSYTRAQAISDGVLVDVSETAREAEDLARIEHEVRVQEKDFRILDETYNEHVMALTIARGYLRSILENGKVVRFLAQNSREFLTEFQRIVESSALET